MRRSLRTLGASVLMLSGLTLTPAMASAEDWCAQPGHYCDRLPECGAANEGQIVWGHTYQYQCRRYENGYYWGSTGQARA